MKINRHGQAKVLTQAELERLFSVGLKTTRDRALFGVCLYAACRINEACTLLTADAYDSKGQVRTHLLLRKANTKGKLATRTIPVIENLRQLLTTYRPEAGTKYLFPGWGENPHLHADSAARVLRKACKKAGIDGASTHSFRRTALTQMSNAGIPLRIIQEISGHRNLEELQKYLEVRPEQVTGAIAALSMLDVGVVIPSFPDTPTNTANPQPDGLPL